MTKNAWSESSSGNRDNEGERRKWSHRVLKLRALLKMEKPYLRARENWSFQNTLGQNGQQRNKQETLNGNYIIVLKVLYCFISCLLLSPFYLRYDSVQKMYRVQQCHILQRISCIFLFILSCVSSLKMVSDMFETLVSNRGSIIAYFDFLNGVILHVVVINLVYIHWFRRDIFVEYFRILQTTPLLQFSSLSLWKARILPAMCWTLSTYMSYIWTIVVFGLKPRAESFAGSYENMARQIFWLKENETVSLSLGLLSILSRFYHSLYLHLSYTLLGPTYLFCVYFVTTDFFKWGVKSAQNGKDVEQVLGFYRNYKELLDSANKISGPLSIHFILMMLSYHSIHLFDALNDPQLIWKINTYFYLIFLLNFLGRPTKSLLAGRKMKKWLWNNQMYRVVSLQELYILLDDYSTKRLGIQGGGLFTISPRFSGLIIQHLISYAMLIAVHTKRGAV